MRADVIFVGEVVDVHPFRLETRDGAVIKTRVTFRVFDAVWGTQSTLEVFDFFGGEWGGIGMAIAEMPRFSIGERRVVFARRERSINPIVGFTQGLLRISRDAAGVDRVFTVAGEPIVQPESIGRVLDRPVPLQDAMRLSDLRIRISRELGARR
jgi:hypothetical protein